MVYRIVAIRTTSDEIQGYVTNEDLLKCDFYTLVQQ